MALVKMKDLLRRAEEKNIGCGAFSVGNMEMVRGAIRAAEELDTPIILQIAEVRLKNSPLHLMGPMMVQAAKEAKVDVAVHLDHGLTFETVDKALELGFTSVMLDASTLPFEENIARVKAVMRRSNLAGTDGIISVDGMSIDLNNKNVKIADALVTLTPKEFELLYFLLKHPKQTFSREKLLTNIWGYDFEGDERTVDATIKRLRQKLLHPHYHYIQTSRGFGYKFEVLKHD